MTQEYLICLAVAVAFFGVVKSVLAIYHRKRAERNFLSLLKEHKEALSMIKNIGVKQDNSVYADRVLTLKEFVRVQEAMKEVLIELHKKERQEILESLEQKSVQGQVDYLNRLVQMDNSRENIVLSAQY